MKPEIILHALVHPAAPALSHYYSGKFLIPSPQKGSLVQTEYPRIFSTHENPSSIVQLTEHPSLFPLSHYSPTYFPPLPHIGFNVHVDIFIEFSIQSKPSPILQLKQPRALKLSHYSGSCLIPSPQLFKTQTEAFCESSKH